MKLKYIDINGYGVLVDESAEIKAGNYIFDNYANINNIQKVRKCDLDSMHYKNGNWYKIIFAEKELNLDVPVLPNWREWEVEKEAKDYVYSQFDGDGIDWLIAKPMIDTYMHCHNKAKYTEEDLRRAIRFGVRRGYSDTKNENWFIQSFQKVPEYIVIEEGVIKEIIY